METTPTAHQLKLSCVKTLHDNWNPLIQKLNFSDVAMHSDRRLLRSRNNPCASSQSVPRDSTAIGNNVCWAARLLLFGRLAWRCHFCCSTCLARWWVQVSYIHLYSLYSILLLFPSPGQILVYKRCNPPHEEAGVESWLSTGLEAFQTQKCAQKLCLVGSAKPETGQPVSRDIFRLL